MLIITCCQHCGFLIHHTWVVERISFLCKFNDVFLVFRKNTPDWLAYLGKVLPPAIIGMLVVYCLKDTKISSAPFGIPELISALLVVALQAWKRNVLVSILAGTICYMALIHFVF